MLEDLGHDVDVAWESMSGMKRRKEAEENNEEK